MPPLQSQQHIAASGKQGGIPFTQQNHVLSLSHIRSKDISRRIPCLLTGLLLWNHRKQQRTNGLVRTDPSTSDARRHAFSSRPGDRAGDQIGCLNRGDGSQREQIRIAGTDPNQGESGGSRLVQDGQRNGRPGVRR